MSLVVTAAAAVLPHIEKPFVKLGPLTLHYFGALVACAVLVGSWVIRRRALTEKLDAEKISRMVFWILVGGFIGAHLVDRFIYFPAETLADPITILMVWKGISSFGGFLGASVAVILFMRKEGMGAEKWRYLDVVAYGFVFGWIFGRAGCFVAFDHPGAPSDFFLAQVFTDGIARHNLGLYEAIYFAFLLAPLYFLLGRTRRNPGFYVGLLCVAYAPIRFALDTWRIVDVRYLGLTPGQFGSIALLLAGLWFISHTRRFATAEAAGAARK